LAEGQQDVQTAAWAWEIVSALVASEELLPDKPVDQRWSRTFYAFRASEFFRPLLGKLNSICLAGIATSEFVRLIHDEYAGWSASETGRGIRTDEGDYGTRKGLLTLLDCVTLRARRQERACGRAGAEHWQPTGLREILRQPNGGHDP
jgi:hypothetical protein